MQDPVHVIAVIDEDGNEALYVAGERYPTEGSTVYSCDIAGAVGGDVIQFSHVRLTGNHECEWPNRFDSLLQYVAKDE